ncbi:hypothetical protein [Lysinibacillus sp. 38-6]|uniref:hypothetical protein n=1 Tax=Lysinibacillus sp. 38-6 TaxID=3385991 RepID=UPI003908B0BB
MEDNRYCKHMNWNHCGCEDEKKGFEHKENKCHKHDECKKCSCMEEMHWWKEEHCKGCICHLLRCLEIGTTVDVYLSSGGSFLRAVFIKLDSRNCCAYFVEPGAAAEPIIIDCQKIDAIRRISRA